MGLEGIFSLLLTFALIAEFVNSVALIISIISLWILFNKAGEKGWKALIPIYNIYTLCKITGVWKGYVFVLRGLEFNVFRKSQIRE